MFVLNACFWNLLFSTAEIISFLLGIFEGGIYFLILIYTQTVQDSLLTYVLK